MYQVHNDKDVKEALSFIGDNVFQCPFLYVNLRKYGIENLNCKLFIEKDSLFNIRAVAYLYYDCLHIYTNENDQCETPVTSLIRNINPNKIFMPSHMLNLFDSFFKDNYYLKTVRIMSPTSFDDSIDISNVKNANVCDIKRISNFMLSEWSTEYSSADVLSRQMEERMKDNYGRTKYLENNGEIVACVSSYAELDDFAVCGGLLVSETQRGKKLGSIMLKSIYGELMNEGKKACGLIVADYSYIFHSKNGFKVVGEIIQCNDFKK